MNSTLAVGTLLAMALVLYWLWQRRDELNEQEALKVVEDMRSMGEVVAVSLSPQVDPDRCIGSGACVAACPEKSVIALVGSQAQLVNPLGCIGHGACATACPVDAIQLVFGTKTRGVELPWLDEHFQTNQPGVYVAGELGGMGLIRNAAIQGQQVAEHIIDGGAAAGSVSRRAIGEAWDVIVVGAGPAGTSATLQLMESGLKVLLMDREGFGGTIMHYPRAKLVMTGPLSFPLYGKVKGTRLTKEQLLEVWDDIRATLNPPLVTGELVTGLTQAANGMWAVESDHQTRLAANVVLALGGRGSPRKLSVPGEDQPKVAYRLLEPEPFANKHVLIVGGGNSAVESALALADFGQCASVTLSYRKSVFARCRAENQQKIQHCLAAGTVVALLSSTVTAIDPQSVQLRLENGESTTPPNDAVIIQAGGTPPSALLSTLGIHLVTKYGER